MNNQTNLHLGCGNVRIPNFLNIDILKTDAVDLVEDIRFLHSFQENSIDCIYACHVLEHFSRKEYLDILSRWFDLLKPNGVLRLSVPDLQEWFNYYNESGDFDIVVGALYGAQKDEFDYHKMGWTKKTLIRDLKKVGFSKTQEYDWRKTSHSQFKDWSRDYAPYHDKNGKELPDEVWFKGRLVSLNMEAIK